MKKEYLVDDFDGRLDGGVEAHSFALDDVVYDIDLAGDNMVELREAMAKFVNVARPRHGSKSPKLTVVSPKGKVTRNDPEQLKKVREWIWTHPELLRDRTLSKHGRIPRDLMEAYQRLAGQPSSLFSDQQAVGAH